MHKTIDKILAALMADRGINQTELRLRTKVGQSTISRILNPNKPKGIKEPTDKQVKPLADFFGVTTDQLRGHVPISQTEASDRQDAAAQIKESNVVTADFKAPARSAMIEVPYLDTAGSMGRGIQRQETDNVIDHIRIDRTYLKSLVSFSLAENLALITGYGDSMKPTFSDGDIMLVDRGVTEVKLDAVYVLARNDEIFIKRLQRRSDGSYRMISDNKAYDPEDVSDLERFEVLGRVIYVWAGSKL